MPMLDAELISQQNRARLLMTFKSRPARPSVNAARLCKVLQLAEFKVPLTGCGGPYSQLFHSFCGKRRGANKLAEGEGLARSFRRKTNLSPDQTSSTAQIFTSTRPAARPIVRTFVSDKSVTTPELFFGHETQSIPAGVNLAAYSENPTVSSLSLLTNNKAKSSGFRVFKLIVTLAGRSRCRAKSRGAFTKATLNPDLIPSFLTRGVPE